VKGSTGRRPKPTAVRRIEGNRGKRAWNHDEPQPPDAIPRCPLHLAPVAKTEWRRVAHTLHKMGVLTTIDRAALAAYCQCYAKWVEAEQKMKETPALLKTPSGYVQQSPWVAIANKQLELMGRYMTELGMTPASRSRVTTEDSRMQVPEITFTTIYEGDPVADFKKRLETIASRMEPKQ
jgi:P27 family predicted phage terminase small subunit